MSSYIDLTGQRFERLVVISYSKTVNGGAHWLCECDCGKLRIASASNLKKGYVKSCGCLNLELISKRSKKHGMANKVPEYGIWKGIIQRCTNPNNDAYFNYGMRGIEVCEQWLHSFENFYADMGKRPTSKHTIERLDNDKGYCSENCIWLLRVLQPKNTRANHWIEYNGRKMILVDWAKELGISHSVICRRLKIQSFESIVKMFQKVG